MGERMRHVAKSIFISTFSLWLTSQTLPTLFMPSGWQFMLTAGIVFALVNLLIVPILKILFIPIHLMTFGLLSWGVYVVAVYLLTVILPELQIRQWTFPGLSVSGVTIAPFHLTYLPALIVTALAITFLTNLFSKINEG